MQDMQKELEAEGEKEKELYDKFMCFCETQESELSAASEKASTAIQELGAKKEADAAAKAGIEQELAEHKSDRDSAKQDLEEATNIRSKEVAEFTASSAEMKANIAAMASAIPALEKGLSGGASFVQFPQRAILKKIIAKDQNLDDYDRRGVTAFLDESTDDDSSSMNSGQIIGILKQMKDDFEANLKEAEDAEATAEAGFKSLQASKQKEIAVASQAIESKTVRSGELAVSIVQTKDGYEDAVAELDDTDKLLSSLKTQCAAKEKTNSASVLARAEEIKAIGEAITILNSDEALDIFKKSGAALVQGSHQGEGQIFLQRSAHKASRITHAQAILAETASKRKSPMMNLMLLSLNSKLKRHTRGRSKGNFDEISKMIEDMIGVLGKETVEDEKQKEWCQTEFDEADDEKKYHEDAVSGFDAKATDLADTIAGAKEEIATLGKEIQDIDKATVLATEQRKQEHSDYYDAMTMNGAALQLLAKAKDKLAKFYSFVQQDQADSAQDLAFVQVRAHVSREESESAHQQVSGSGILALLDQLMHDLKLGAQDAENNEKSDQKDYETLMAESSKTRTSDAEAITKKKSSNGRHGSQAPRGQGKNGCGH